MDYVDACVQVAAALHPDGFDDFGVGVADVENSSPPAQSKNMLPSRSSKTAPSPLEITQGAAHATPLGIAFCLRAINSMDLGPGRAVFICGSASLNILFNLLSSMLHSFAPLKLI